MAKYFIHHPVTAIVISLVLLIAGGLSIGTLPVAQYPQISPPTVEVEINYFRRLLYTLTQKETELNVYSLIRISLNTQANQL